MADVRVMTDELKKAAEKYQSDWHHHRFAYSKDYTPESAFLAGASWARAEVRSILRAHANLAALDELEKQWGKD